MSRFASGDGACCNDSKQFEVCVGKAHLGQRRRESHGSVEPHDIDKLAVRAALDNELYQESKCHLLAVQKRVRARGCGESVVHRVSNGESARFEAEA